MARAGEGRIVSQGAGGVNGGRGGVVQLLLWPAILTAVGGGERLRGGLCERVWRGRCCVCRFWRGRDAPVFTR